MSEPGADPVDPYRDISTFYDLEHDPFQEDIDLFLSFAEATGGPILEMGCGSGRVIAPLASAGFSVVGLDRSTTMLDHARARIVGSTFQDRVTLVEANMDSDASIRGEPFQLVIFSLNALMHLASPEDQLDALVNARKRLTTDGLLVIDVVNPAPDYLVSLASSSSLEWSTTLGDGSVVDKWALRHIHPIDQVIDTTLWYDQVNPGGELIRHRSRFNLRYIHPNELSLMLRSAGFHDVRMYGSYELDPLDDASDRIVVTAGWNES